MRRATLACAVALVLSLPLASCYTMTHEVGTGGTGAAALDERQWYALWGLVPVGKVDSQALAGGAANYTVKTEQTFVDVIIGFFTSWVSFVPFTVEVQR